MVEQQQRAPPRPASNKWWRRRRRLPGGAVPADGDGDDAADDADGPATTPHPGLLLLHDCQATASSCFVDDDGDDGRLESCELDVPFGVRVPRHRLVRSGSRSGSGRSGGRPPPAPSPSPSTAPYWPAGIGAYTRKGYLRGHPQYKARNQDRCFAVVAETTTAQDRRASASSSPFPSPPLPPPPPPLLLLGVLDGHGTDGHSVSAWLARQFPLLLAQHLPPPIPPPLQPPPPPSDCAAAPPDHRDHHLHQRRPLLPLPFGRAAAAAADAPMFPSPPADDSSRGRLVRALPPLTPAELAPWRAAFADADRLLPGGCRGGPSRVVDSGSTACVVRVCGRSGELTAAWVGDSRACVGGWRPASPPSAALFLETRKTTTPTTGAPATPVRPFFAMNATAAPASPQRPAAVALSDDHKPERADERARVLLCGGRVEPMRVGPPPGVHAGPFRVWCGRRDYPGLAMSRAFGDLGARPAGVVSEPEVRRWRLLLPPPGAAAAAAAAAEQGRWRPWPVPSPAPSPRPELAVSPLLLVASDGVFEYMDNDEAVEAAAAGAERATAAGAGREDAAAAAAEAVVEAAEHRWRRREGSSGYCDDITAIVALW